MGIALAIPDGLVQPLTVAVTVYVPAFVTVMPGVVAPVLHSSDPAAFVDKVDDPQLFTTVITGAGGIVLGVAVQFPGVLVHPFTVVVTEYVPGVVTVIAAVVAPVLQVRNPTAFVESVDDPQLSVTVTAGAGGMATGAAMPLPAVLVHPFTVVVTEYVPGVVTVMLDVAAPVFHSRVPAAVVDRVDDPQLFTTVTNGAAGTVLGAAVALPGRLVHPFTVVVTVYIPGVATVMLEVVAPVFHSRLPAAVVDKVDDPQLFIAVTTGVGGIVLGAALLLPAGLVHPFTVVVTV